jgi:DNA polymerase-3 subunit beta
MKFSAGSTELLKALTKANGAVPSKSTLPILENFLFELTNDTLKITATDLEILLSTSLKVKGEESGKIAIPAKRIMETVRALPNTELKFSADKTNKKLSMKTKNGEYTLAGEGSDDYPTIPLPKTDEKINLDRDIMVRYINETIFAVSTDELRPAMMGVLFQIQKNEMRAVATDGHRLVRISGKNVGEAKIEKDIIVPAKALNTVVKSIEEDSCSIAIDDAHAVFSFGETVLVSRLIGEKYPNYESVIPTDNDKKLVVSRNEMLSSVRRIALYASSTTHQVRFSLKKDSLTISAEDVDFGNQASETLSCSYTDEPMDIGFNANYIIDILSHMDTEEMEFLLSTPTRAGIVKPGKQRNGEDLLMLVMPVRLNT